MVFGRKFNRLFTVIPDRVQCRLSKSQVKETETSFLLYYYNFCYLWVTIPRHFVAKVRPLHLRQ